MSVIGCEIITGARLHFGLLDTVKPFGGVGMMISEPQTVVSAISTPSDNFTVLGPGRSRVQKVARRFASAVGLRELPRIRLEILSRPLPHTGLGSGTQLDLAVAEALQFVTTCELSSTELATQVAARGQRSAIGVHGYWHGGFIHDLAADKDIGGFLSEGDGINGVRARAELPEHWRIALLSPEDWDNAAIAGEVERKCFQSLKRPSMESKEELFGVLTSSLIPAALSGDFDRFCESIRKYNYLAGMFFSEVQGGAYNGLQITNCINHLLDEGFVGVGQSSWGPSVFVFCETRYRVEGLIGRPPAGWKVNRVATPLNTGRSLRPFS